MSRTHYVFLEERVNNYFNLKATSLRIIVILQTMTMHLCMNSSYKLKIQIIMIIVKRSISTNVVVTIKLEQESTNEIYSKSHILKNSNS